VCVVVGVVVCLFVCGCVWVRVRVHFCKRALAGRGGGGGRVLSRRKDSSPEARSNLPSSALSLINLPPLPAQMWSITQSFMCVPWLIYVCGMNMPSSALSFITLPHLPSQMCVIWLNHSCVCHDSFMCVTCSCLVQHWVGSLCRRLPICASRASFICVTWLNEHDHASPLFTCWHDSLPSLGMTHSYQSHDLFICVPWLLYMCDIYCPFLLFSFHLTLAHPNLCRTTQSMCAMTHL